MMPVSSEGFDFRESPSQISRRTSLFFTGILPLGVLSRAARPSIGGDLRGGELVAS
jgi:hypothetical protein